jgi:hypothetical protein
VCGCRQGRQVSFERELTSELTPSHFPAAFQPSARFASFRLLAMSTPGASTSTSSPQIEELHSDDDGVEDTTVQDGAAPSTAAKKKKKKSKGKKALDKIKYVRSRSCIAQEYWAVS